MNSTIKKLTRAEKSKRTRARNSNPLRENRRVPKREVPAVIQRFGREICSETEDGQAEYRARVLRMLKRQGNFCCICGLFCPEEEATFEHGDLRGMGGGRRNDSEFAPGNGAAHGWCNGQKGSVRVVRTGRFTI